MNNKTYVYNLGQLFVNIAEERGNEPAIRLVDSSVISFHELKDLSDTVLAHLFAKGCSRGDVVVLLNDKSQQAFAVMIACLRLGVAYANLDPNSPPERLKKMIKVSRPRHICINRQEHIDIIEQLQVDAYDVTDYRLLKRKENENHEFDKFSSITSKVNGETPAYLMFTSGSTGFPKGVVIKHASVLNFIHWARHTFNISPLDRLTNLNPLHFDNSVFDFYASIFNGASMIAVPEKLLQVPRRLLDKLNELQPTLWFSVPSLLVYITKMRAWRKTDLPHLRLFSFGGEGFPKSQLRFIWSLFQHRTEFINVYGPTEGTCICSSYKVEAADIESDELLPLGPIAPNFDFIVIDSELNVLKSGETGELCLLGPNLALGYFNNHEKTKESFIPVSCDVGYKQIMYRTGDLVLYDEDEDVIKFKGRNDNQIKRMGYRIELEEIEVALGSLEKNHENAVVYKKIDESRGSIIAFVSSSYGNENELLHDLRKLIPQYMVPNKVVFLESLPKNQNGKIDRIALKRGDL